MFYSRLKSLFSPKGYVSREHYWIVFTLYIFVMFGTGRFYSMGKSAYDISLMLIVLNVYLLGIFSVKRAHDLGRSGKFALLLLIPIVSLWPLWEFVYKRSSPHILTDKNSGNTAAMKK